MKDTRTRSIAKGVSWRAVATLTTITLVFLFTGNLTTSLGLGVVEVTAKLAFYYLHERVWERTGWGRRST